MPLYKHYAEQAERARRRAAQDAALRQRHAQFDLQAQDQHHKHDRAHFAVVGEGSRAAQDAYREGWEQVFGRTPCADSPSA